MKKAKSIAIIASLCFITVGWAVWYGDTYHHNEDIEGHVSIITQPADGETESTGFGGYHLGLDNGMIEGRYYYFIKGTKVIHDQWHQGKYWTNCQYQSDSSITGCDIHLSHFDDK